MFSPAHSSFIIPQQPQLITFTPHHSSLPCPHHDSSLPPVEEQLRLITRGVEKIVPQDELRKKLQHSRDTGVPLRVKYGIDPTGIDVHLGHTVPLRKLRQFQDLGHQAVIIIGNYTALVGDPSGRDEARSKRLTADEVEHNARDYLNQVGKVVDLQRAEVHRNGDWFSRMSFADVLGLCGRVTIAQLLTRDDFAKRYREERAIFLHECLYPVMQAWDSVEIRSDVELGGTEQLYSFMLARDLQAQQNLNQQIAVMSPILVGLDGVRRMGKSLGNYIGISEPAYEMMKKFMQLPDGVMRMYFELLTELPMDQVDALSRRSPQGSQTHTGPHHHFPISLIRRRHRRSRSLAGRNRRRSPSNRHPRRTARPRTPQRWTHHRHTTPHRTQALHQQR
ncbi:MAG UNVERIFIED_CONTAM: tyrosine--tRNA ligase [Planctomycetaceae bacterium]